MYTIERITHAKTNIEGRVHRGTTITSRAKLADVEQGLYELAAMVQDLAKEVKGFMESASRPRQ